jgi:hypothetical protein
MRWVDELNEMEVQYGSRQWMAREVVEEGLGPGRLNVEEKFSMQFCSALDREYARRVTKRGN